MAMLRCRTPATVWPRRRPALPDLAEELASARASLYASVAAVIWGVAFVVFTPLGLGCALVGAVVAATAVAGGRGRKRSLTSSRAPSTWTRWASLSAAALASSRATAANTRAKRRYQDPRPRLRPALHRSRPLS